MFGHLILENPHISITRHLFDHTLVMTRTLEAEVSLLGRCSRSIAAGILILIIDQSYFDKYFKTPYTSAKIYCEFRYLFKSKRNSYFNKTRVLDSETVCK